MDTWVLPKIKKSDHFTDIVSNDHNYANDNYIIKSIEENYY